MIENSAVINPYNCEAEYWRVMAEGLRREVNKLRSSNEILTQQLTAAMFCQLRARGDLNGIAELLTETSVEAIAEFWKTIKERFNDLCTLPESEETVDAIQKMDEHDRELLLLLKNIFTNYVDSVVENWREEH